MVPALLPDAAFGLLPRCHFVTRHPFFCRLTSTGSIRNRCFYRKELVQYFLITFALVIQTFPYQPYVIIICVFLLYIQQGNECLNLLCYCRNYFFAVDKRISKSIHIAFSRTVRTSLCKVLSLLWMHGPAS